MKISIYELLGMVKDKVDIDIYIRYYDKLSNKTDVMLACKENIIYNLDRTSIELNDTVEILEEKKIPEKIEREIYIENGVKISSEPSIEQIMNKLNEVIDYLKSKGE